MTEKMIRDAYARIRTIDQTIPDDVLDFMRDASIEKLKQVNNNLVLSDVSGQLLAFTEWQKKYKDSSYVDMFNVEEYLKASNLR